MMPFFIINNWIESYQTLSGIKKVLRTLSSQTSLPKQTRFAMRVLKKNYYSLQDDFMEFFPQLIDYVEKDFGIEISHRITMPF
jgi:acyl carrier protein phosphodiesterase